MNIHNDGLKEAALAVLQEEVLDDQVDRDIDDSTIALDEAGAAVDGYSRTVEEVTLNGESLEAYVSRFMAAVPEGDWNQRVSRQYQCGMGAVLAAMGVSVESKHYVESFEAVGTTQTGEENRQKSKDKADGILKRVGEALKAAIVSLIEAITTMIGSIGKNEDSLRKMSANLKLALNEAKGEGSQSGFEKTPAWADYLSVGGKQVSPRDALQIANTVNRTQCTQWIDAYLTAHDELVTLAKSNKEVSDEEIKAIAPQTSLQYKVDWPCNTTTEISSGEGKLDLLQASIAKKSTGNDVEIKAVVLEKSDISMIATELESIANVMKDVNAKLKTALAKVKQDQQSLAGEVSPAAARALGKMLPKLPQIVRVNLPLAGATAQKAFKHAKASLALYK